LIDSGSAPQLGYKVIGEVIDIQARGSYTVTTNDTRHPFTWKQRRKRRWRTVSQIA
jgi:hypothetical protein